MIRIIETAQNTDLRLTEVFKGNEHNKLVASADKASTTTIKVDESKTYQQMIGFGGAFTEATTYTLSKMSKDIREEVLKLYFDPIKGLAYNIGRVHIHSCDFALGNYTYVEDNDVELSTFDISHERKWTIPFIKDAMKVKGGPINLLASPWSPPAWMKDTKEMNNGGHLLPEFFSTWAKYYVKFIKAMREEGLVIDSITVQNEPAAVQTWDSCIYSGQEERDFVKNYLGPIMEQEGLSHVKIFIWDHNRDAVVERASAVFDDPEASKYVYGTGIHWYVSEEFENVGKVHDLYPDKHILFTEGCQEGGVHLGSWLTGERYGRNMIGDFNNWCEGYLDWNLVLDETGGPNHVNNLCDAPIIADTTTNEIHVNSSYYYIGHFSKYVKANAYRVDTRLDNKCVLGVSFVNDDQSVVVVLQNENNSETLVKLEVLGKKLRYEMKARSIVTIIVND